MDLRRRRQNNGKSSTTLPNKYGAKIEVRSAGEATEPKERFVEDKTSQEEIKPCTIGQPAKHFDS
jgi:hypothetical protein